MAAVPAEQSALSFLTPWRPACTRSSHHRYTTWLDAHIAAAVTLGKPFVLEEFQQPYSEAQRDRTFEAVREVLARSRQQAPSSPAAGALQQGCGHRCGLGCVRLQGVAPCAAIASNGSRGVWQC